MIGSARMFGLLAIVALGALLGGCGSGDEATTNDGAAAEAAPAGSGETSGADRQGKTGAGGNRDSELPGKSKGKGEQNGPHSGDAPDERGSDSTRREIVKRKLEKSCPPEADEASCEAMVEEFLVSKGKSKASEVAGPEDCTRAMSREECEATLKAQKAAEDTYSVDVEECLDNPTPRCEEVLRPYFEQQQAAEQSGS